VRRGARAEMASRTKRGVGKRARKSQRTAKGGAPTFTVKFAEDGAYYVQMDGNASAPTMHIGNFVSEATAQAWIRDESAAWFAKWVAVRTGETELEMAVRHVAEQEQRIACQEALIARLREIVAPGDRSLKLLGEMKDLLETMRAHVARLSN
jgi:hypothetical protein